ncbi:MAG TPA: sigma-70 family RNA polymerase sigma factor [Verrucomicrobiae bacterium]
MVSLNPTFVELDAPETRSLVGQAQAGDVAAFGQICRVYETRLLRQAMALCGNEANAEELTQDTLVEAWKCLRRYNERCQFFTWLCAILLNRWRNTIRKKRPAPFATLANGDRMEVQNSIANLADERPAPDLAVQMREQAALVWKCVHMLPLKQQQVVYLRFYVDDSLDGIAAALGCSTGTVKSRLFHALDTLRAMNDLKSSSQTL